VLLLAVPSPGGAIVIVDDVVVHASTDGGLTYRELFRASDGLGDAAVGSDGTIYVVHRDDLVILRGNTVTTRALKNAQRVVVDGRTVAVLTEEYGAGTAASAMVVSRDGGATFTSRPVPVPCESCPQLQGTWDMTIASGSPFLVETSINTCTSADVLEWQRLVQFGPVPFQRSLPVSHRDFAASWKFGAFGWMYGITYAERLMAISASAITPVIGVPKVTMGDRLTVAHNQRVTVATIGDALVDLNGANARVLDAHAKATDIIAVDGDDRPLVSDGKQLWRFSRITGWTKLALP
jgi:hypothetical protein